MSTTRTSASEFGAPDLRTLEGRMLADVGFRRDGPTLSGDEDDPRILPLLRRRPIEATIAFISILGGWHRA